MTLPVWLEVHVDAEVLEGGLPWTQRARHARLSAELSTLARRAEDAGARLSFRVRERFARGDEGLIAGLVARGHEVGWHAHGKRLHAARDAVVAHGGSAAYATPGLVQAGAEGWEKMAAEAASLGARVMTDRVEAPLWAYQGWLAHSPAPGLVAMEVSVSPFDWGVLTRQGRRVVPGRLDPTALLARLAARERQVPPPGALAFFGATFHDHDLARRGTLDDLSRLFDRLGPRIQTSGHVAEGWVPEEAAPEEGRFDKWKARVHRVAMRLERSGAPARDVHLEADGRPFAARRVGPAAAHGVLVLVHGGESGVAQGLAPFGLSEAALAEKGLAAWTFARSEGHRPPGSLETVAETRAVLVEALREGKPVALLTWSAGVIAGARAAVALGDPRVVAIIDGEGPADRFSLVPPGQPDNAFARVDPFDDKPWAGREAVAAIAAFPGRYLRLQASPDHVHGRMAWHARRMVAAARDGRMNDGKLLPGRLDHHGGEILEWIVGVFEG